MGCLLALLAGFAPRVALVLIWIFSNLVDRAFTGFLIPLLGLIVFPYATLFYVLAYNPVTGVWAAGAGRSSYSASSSTSVTGPAAASAAAGGIPAPSSRLIAGVSRASPLHRRSTR